LGLSKTQEACEVATQGRQKFPQEDAIRTLWKRCESAAVGERN